MKKNCLTCEFEPDWSEWIDAGYKRCHGKCKWEDDGLIPDLPQVYILNERHVTRYGDDSGICHSCKTWKPKKI